MNPSAQSMEKATQGLMQMCEELNAFARESMDVAMKSAAAFTKGCDETMRSASALIQENMSHAMNAGKNIAGCKDMNEMMNRHSEFVKECSDRCMTAGGRMSEIMTRTTKEAMEPVAQHTNNAMSKMMQKARTAA